MAKILSPRPLLGRCARMPTAIVAGKIWYPSPYWAWGLSGVGGVNSFCCWWLWWKSRNSAWCVWGGRFFPRPVWLSYGTKKPNDKFKGKIRVIFIVLHKKSPCSGNFQFSKKNLCFSIKFLLKFVNFSILRVEVNKIFRCGGSRPEVCCVGWVGAWVVGFRPGEGIRILPWCMCVCHMES